MVLRLDLGQISFNLVENAFATRQLALLATRFTLSTFWFARVQKSKFWDGGREGNHCMSLGFLIFELFSFSFLFAAVIDLLLGLLAVKKQWQEILLWVFHSSFWTFLCLSRAPSGRSLWSGHHWKELFLLPKWSKDDASFGQKWWHQKWKKGQGSSQVITGGTGVNG